MRRRARTLDESGAHSGFGRALLMALIGFALGAGATFLAWRYNLLALARTTPLPPNQVQSAPQPSPPAALSEAARVLREQAASEPRAQNELGVLYQLGKGVEHDDTEALKWYRKAAERGFALAQSNLGWMLEHGRGVDKDPISAVFWYKLAAQGGDANGQYNLALMYEHGSGLALDRAQALQWYDKAARQGYAAARAAAARLRASAAPDAEAADRSAGSSAAAEPNAADVAASAASAAGPPSEAASGVAPALAAANATALSIAIDVDNAFDGSGYAGTWHQRGAPATVNQLTYRAERRGERVVVTPSSQLHAATAAQPPVAAKSVAEALQWQLPRLSLSIENATTSALRLTALEVHVQRSEAERGALLFVPSEMSALLELDNIGWGRAKQPALKLGFAPARVYDSIDPRSAATSETLSLDDLDEGLRVALKDRTPAALSNAAVTVFGTLSYATEAGVQRVLPFKSLMHFDRAVVQRRWRPRFFHHVLLQAGKLGVSTLPLAANIGALRSAQVKLRLGSDRSARYELALALKGEGGALLATQTLEVEIFVPRYDAAAIAATPSALKLAAQ